MVSVALKEMGPKTKAMNSSGSPGLPMQVFPFLFI